MENHIEISENFRKKEINKVIIIEKIKNNKYDEIFDGICSISNDSAFINYPYFKHFAGHENYDIILHYIVSRIEHILTYNQHFSVHVNADKLSLSDVDKHRYFINKMTNVLTEKFPCKLHKCYIYDAPFVFAQVFSLISKFIDKETQRKIHVINNK
jgi:hypothetical protein